MPDLSHTPGIYYALAYWLSCTCYLAMFPRKYTGMRFAVIQAAFFALLASFMVFTDGVSKGWFLPCVCVNILLIMLDIKICCGMNWFQTAYTGIQAFVLGEFSAALEWQLYYYAIVSWRLPRAWWVVALFLILTHGSVFGVLFLRERKYQDIEPLDITWRELSSAALICVMVFGVSNLSYVSENTPFSSQFTSEIFIIRTLVDLGGVAILHAYNVRLQDLHMKLEMASLQNMLQMHYNNYRISEDSIALVNQKYHDLKHHIQLLRSEISTGEKLAYLDQMEEEIHSYEAQNKTGNRVLDTILTAKGLLCEREGISMTCVADGEALDFIQPMDLSALFGNALDNAIESVKKIADPEKRLIHVSIARQRGFLRIRVENCYEGELNLESGIPPSTKQDKRYHGYGLKSIQAIAAKYGGTMGIASKDGWFELRILFPAQGAAKEAQHGNQQ